MVIGPHVHRRSHVQQVRSHRKVSMAFALGEGRRHMRDVGMASTVRVASGSPETWCAHALRLRFRTPRVAELLAHGKARRMYAE